MMAYTNPKRKRGLNSCNLCPRLRFGLVQANEAKYLKSLNESHAAMRDIMRPSRVLKKFRTGAVANCMKLNFSDARVAEMAASYDFDCLWLCMEHVANTLEQMENQVRAAKVFDVDTLIRVPRGSYSDMIRPLEMDAAGIIVPHVKSADEAAEIAQMTRFHPIGRRPIDGGNADARYCSVPIESYCKQANRERIVCVQIEDPEAVEDIENIAQVEGITMFYFGPQDFSHAIGLPGQTRHPEVQEVRRRVAAVARKYGKFAGTSRAGLPLAELVEMGYQLITPGSDVIGLKSYWDNLAEELDASGVFNA